MDIATIEKLITLNRTFYAQNARSFSATRQQPWQGWERVAEYMPHTPCTVLDVACGNMRFKEFLEGVYGNGVFAYHGIDACADLVPENLLSFFSEEDVLQAALDGRTPLLQGGYDFVACFGFLHHVPSMELRKRVIDLLIAWCAPGGTIAISFWQFARDEKLRRKADATTSAGCAALDVVLEEGDSLLGWNDLPDVYRYCHSFTDEEIDELCAYANPHARCIARFRADGKTNDLNTYLVFRL